MPPMRVKHLLKSAAHQHKDPQVRLAHVRELDTTADGSGELLAALARTDDDVAVRIAAIGRLDDLAVLRELLDADGDDAERTRVAAEERLGAMIEAGGVSDVAIRALLDTHAAPLASLVASLSPVPEQREAALAAIDDETVLLGIVQTSRLHDARQAAASRLTRHDTMRAALGACRSRDKVVAKLLQQRLDAEAAAEAERIARRHAVSTTLESMRALADGVWSPQYGGRAQALRERWAAFEQSDTEADAEAFAAADARARAVVEEHTRSSPSKADTSSADAVGADERDGGDGSAGKAGDARSGGPSGGSGEEPGPSATAASGSDVPDPATPVAPPSPEALAVAARLQPLAIAELSDAVGESGEEGQGEGVTSEAAGGALRAHARAVAVLFDPPYDHRRARPAALRQRLARVDALLGTDTLLPGFDLSGHRYLQELVEHRAALADRLGKSEQESSDRIKATHRQFAALGGIIGEGKWAPANSLLKRLQKKLAAMEPAERKGLDEKLVHAEKQLAEMGDWQDFAARPKLEALCEEMEALPGRELTVPKLAKEVRDLQSQWKSLGPSRAANELWPRFKSAGDAAYEPCKTFFAAKGEERQAKIEARRQICEALEADVAMLGNALVAEPAPAPASRTDADGAAPDGSAPRERSGESRAPGDGDTDAPESVPSDGATGDGATGGGDTGEHGSGSGDRSGDAAATAGADGEGSPATTGTDPDSARKEKPDVAPDSASGVEPDGASDAPAAATPAPAADLPEPDWKAIQRRVGDAKREWSRNRITDRKPDRALEARFSAALKPYERALSTRYAENEAAKRALIDRAAALAGGEITQHVANQAKSLLSAWKQVGIVPRRLDQSLWETFNGHLGTVFRHQQAAVREKRRAGLEHVDRARAIARELRALAKGPSVDEAAVQTLADEFHALAEFPERDRRGLERDFRAALDATARVQETAGKRRKQAEREERMRLVALCERLETAVEEHQTDETASALIEDVRHAWEASETRVARDMAVRLEGRRDAALAHLAEGRGFDLAANEEIRRDLLIRMEVAADIETPPEDKPRRMRYQLENLQSGMTSAGVADRRATLAALEADWLAAPPVSRSVHDSLQSRFLKAQGR